MSNQNNIPQLRFKEFEGVIKEVKFGKVVSSNIYGPRFNANDYSDFGNVKTIRGTDLGSDGEIKYDQVPLALLDEKMVNTHKLLEGDIVMITTAECGATGVYRKQEIDFLSSAYGVRLRLNEHGYPYYFKYFFQTHQAKKEINSYIRKSTIANLPGSDILRIKVFLPSFPEQQKIASFLNAVDEKIQQLSRKKELLEHYKKGVMQQLFSGKLRFKDENGNEYPEWEEKKLGDIGIFQTSSIDKLSKENELEVYLVNYMNVYRHEEINNNTIKHFQVVTAKENQIRSCDLRKGDILFTPSSETPTDIGHSVVIFEDIENAVYSYHLMRFRPKLKMDILYSHYFCNIPEVLNQLSKLATGSTRFTISVKSFSSIEVKLPCFNEQQKIANFLSSIDAKIENTKGELEKVQLFKKGLLQQLFV